MLQEDGLGRKGSRENNLTAVIIWSSENNVGLGGAVEMKRHGQDDIQNQWAGHLDWLQPGKSPRSEYTKWKRVHAQGISPYMSHTQGSEKVPGSTLKPPSKKEKKNLVDKTTNKSVFMPHK